MGYNLLGIIFDCSLFIFLVLFGNHTSCFFTFFDCLRQEDDNGKGYRCQLAVDPPYRTAPP